MPPDDVEKFIKSLQEEIADIRKQALDHAWSMRGGCTYETVLRLSHKERQMISKISKDNLEITKKSGMPFF